MTHNTIDVDIVACVCIYLIFSSGTREAAAPIETPPSLDWNEVNSQRRNSLSSPSEDELGWF